ncbi:hypothetical protein DICPUDRAFT_77206 [Dictyostelium purpureum]|uniref:PX domain-containing protein n=1 Tax=Dictyostelium purpureum TaxID=5786 RepID=F0ZFX5_DICPU|nr:uncharacterized protein DICPUDRAFT_77206 [Dictyostelium purpureum]EGC37116.1 hypothetical protein DICPUDRAFT_77206 [Dictyostelium purpureum]|eukprot:XP_003286319.1 hypothetical protein DICPUDRAFT_77206 [Dictyostelium purpureum]
MGKGNKSKKTSKTHSYEDDDYIDEYNSDDVEVITAIKSKQQNNISKNNNNSSSNKSNNNSSNSNSNSNSNTNSKNNSKQKQQNNQNSFDMEPIRPSLYNTLSTDDDGEEEEEENNTRNSSNGKLNNFNNSDPEDEDDSQEPVDYDDIDESNNIMANKNNNRNINNNNSNNNHNSNKKKSPSITPPQKSNSPPPREQQVEWLLQNENIIFQRDGVLHKINMGSIFITNQRIVWTVEDNSELLVSIDIAKVLYSNVSPSTSQQVWKLKAPGNDYLFIFSDPWTRESVAELVNEFRKIQHILNPQKIQQAPPQQQQQDEILRRQQQQEQEEIFRRQQQQEQAFKKKQQEQQEQLRKQEEQLKQREQELLRQHQDFQRRQQEQDEMLRRQQQQQQQQQQSKMYPSVSERHSPEFNPSKTPSPTLNNSPPYSPKQQSNMYNNNQNNNQQHQYNNNNVHVQDIDDGDEDDEDYYEEEFSHKNNQKPQISRQEQEEQLLRQAQLLKQEEMIRKQKLQQEHLQQQKLQQEQQQQQQQRMNQQLQQQQAHQQQVSQQQPNQQPNQQTQQNNKKTNSNDDDGFFNVPINMVGDDGDSKWEEESNGVELAGYYDLEVKDPKTHSDESGVYVSYAIHGKYKESATSQPVVVQTRRRYREFEWLHQQISIPSSLHSRIPSLPQKSIYQFWNKTDVNLLRQRCSALDQFMKNISVSATLRNHTTMKLFMGSKSIPTQPTTITENLINISNNILSPTTITSLTNAISGGGAISASANPMYQDSIDANFSYESSVERDYWITRKLMSKWNRIPKRLPFSKFLVVVLGTVSAGKSSFINNFYNLQVKVSADEQLDTHFTLIETIPRQQFYELSDQQMPKKFTREQLNEKIKGEPVSDPRHGHVFLYLDKTFTLSRYDAQFSNYRDIISNLNLVRTVLINEEYLTGTPDEIMNQKKTIFIDSPGFEPKTEHDPEKLLGSIRVVQFFQSTSDLTLFMMKAKELALVSSQVQIVELCVLYKTYGPEIVDHMVTQMFNKKGESKSFFSLFEMVKGLVEQIRLKNIPKTQESNGTSVWDGIKFVMTQIDSVNSNLKEQFFELGRLLGKGLMFLDPPTFRQCKAIALPMDRKFNSIEERKEKCGDLDELLYYIYNLNRGSTYNSRLEGAIEEMTTDLLCNIQKSWTNYLFNSDYNLVLQLKERSKNRDILP